MHIYMLEFDYAIKAIHILFWDVAYQHNLKKEWDIPNIEKLVNNCGELFPRMCLT
jgi:hypothetical protein